MDYQAVIPEFVVSDIEKSRHFYCDLLGFSVEYDRPEEKFLFLSLEDCQLMLEEGTPEELANLTYPFDKVVEADYPIHRPLTKREFRVGDNFIYPHEFAILDPDGYFLRFSE
ncbi:VOC family protein [Streptococcus pseudopneumoniae]|uniref:bleomycin resistance protein n=1 Tax=Streptococcus pseudopneumoniae TaxID=257758 RepID=UPI0018B0D737|nr:VOC family protein [Streptococcus pseudopneumoniae]MBF9675231.1 VOC family protein [Streptococcus pseudopneumoniae]